MLAIDLGGTSAKCGFIINGEIVSSFTVPTDMNHVVKNIYETSLIKSREENFKLDEIDAIGFASPGLIDTKNGKVVFASNFGWKDFDLKSEIENIFKCKKIFILNDAKAATYGSWKIDFDKKIPSMMLITLGTGIGGGVILNNKIITGDNVRLPSEPGHGGGFQSQVDCPCGLLGCVEPVASGRGMTKLLRKKASECVGPLNELFKLNNSFSLRDIFDLLESNDKETIETLEFCMTTLAKMISVIIHTFDLSAIVIAGGPTNLGEPLLKILKNEIKKYTLPAFYNSLNIIFSTMKGDAGLIGIKEYILDQSKKLITN